jgi:hypothetical protein
VRSSSSELSLLLSTAVKLMDVLLPTAVLPQQACNSVCQACVASFLIAAAVVAAVGCSQSSLMATRTAAFPAFTANWLGRW